jgi:hypothetical protein
MQIDSATDILGLIDIQPTFMPGGELAVAEGMRLFQSSTNSSPGLITLL